MKHEYAQAVVRAQKGGASDDAIVKNLVAHLTRVGRVKLLPGILAELRVLKAREKVLAPTIEVASKEEEPAALAAAKAQGIEADHAHVNHSLIRGWRARAGGKLVDRSAKRMLTTIYQNVVSGT